MSQNNSAQLERVAPHDSEAERMILGVLLLDGGALYAETAAALPVGPNAKPEDTFSLHSHRVIFAAMGRIVLRGHSLEPLILQNELQATGDLERVGGPAYLSSLYDGVPRFSNIDNYTRAVKEQALRREVLTQARFLMEIAYDKSESVEDVIERAQRVGYDLELPGCRDTWESVKEMADVRFSEIITISEANKSIIGTATGFYDLDYLTAGFEPGELVYVAGRPSMGKSGFAFCAALNAAKHAANEGKTVAVFSMEMSKKQVVNRWYGQEARIDLRRLRTGTLSSEEWKRLNAARVVLSRIGNLTVDDRPALSPMQVRAKLRRLRKPLSLVLVDYLSLMRLPGASRAQESSEKIRCEALSQELKAIAKEFNTPLIAILPLNKTEGQDVKAPTLNDVSYVGGYEPDIVLMLHREEYYKPETTRVGLADLIIGKNRNGPTGKIELRFNKVSASFENLRKDNDL